MSKIKFYEDFKSGLHIFPRNSIWDFIDKYRTMIGLECFDECSTFGFVYRVKAGDIIHHIVETAVVEIDHIINKDYTEEEWEMFITQDALVKDGDYVKAWIQTFGINKPVKDSTDQCDYNGKWESLQKKIEKEYGPNQGFDTT